MFGVIGVRIAEPLIDARSIFFRSRISLLPPSSESNRDGRGNALTGCCRQKPLAAPASVVQNGPARSLIDCLRRRQRAENGRLNAPLGERSAVVFMQKPRLDD